jgi:hypothetical protein
MISLHNIFKSILIIGIISIIFLNCNLTDLKNSNDVKFYEVQKKSNLHDETIQVRSKTIKTFNSPERNNI